MNILPSTPGRNSRYHLLLLRVPKKTPCLWRVLFFAIPSRVRDFTLGALMMAAWPPATPAILGRATRLDSVPSHGPGQRKYSRAEVRKRVYSAGLLGAKTEIPA